MADNGIGACADDPLALRDLDDARCIAVLLEHPQDQHVTAPRPKEQGFHGFLCRQIAIPI